jgi:hypothetical protein
MMELWELHAREAIRDSFAQYTHAGDHFPLQGVADSFCEDGVLEPLGGEPVRGRATIEAFRIGARERTGGTAGARVLRHNVTNIWFQAVTRESAQVLSCYTVFSDIGLDHFGRYQDRFVPVGDRWLIAHRLVTLDWRSKDSPF